MSSFLLVDVKRSSPVNVKRSSTVMKVVSCKDVDRIVHYATWCPANKERTTYTHTHMHTHTHIHQYQENFSLIVV